MHVHRPPVVDRKVRFALVGCGRIAANHFDAIVKHAAHCELTDVCDIDSEALRVAIERTGAQGHRSLTSMLSQSRADCVVLTSPSGLHPAQAIEAARAGFDVMTEKPMATRWSDGLAMVRACDEAGVRLFVVKQNRRNPTLRLLKSTSMSSGRGHSLTTTAQRGVAPGSSTAALS
jgi:UDP-N-acetyl-2-amino-2-deoxyglucuronate dehydrogenase